MKTWIAIDTETELIQPGRLVPRLVCMSWADNDAGDAGVSKKEDAPALFRMFADLPEMGFVFHNAAYDLAVLVEHDESLLPLVIDLLDAGRIADTYIVEQLKSIRAGEMRSSKRPSLAGLSAKYLNEELEKEDTWRLRYGELIDVPLSEWPADAVEYARKDAEVTLRVFEAQGADKHGCADLNLQVCASVALHAMSAWGMRTDPDAVGQLEVDLLEATLAKRDDLLRAGILKWKHKTKKVETSRDMKVIKSKVEAALGELAPRTEKGAVKTDDETLSHVPDPAIQLLRGYQADQKELSSFVPVVRQGTTCPINARYNILVATGRTSCSKPNMQQLPRRPGVRECFVPRPGYLFASADWSAAELCALAQVNLAWFGESAMAEAINEGRDLHCDMAADIEGVPYEDVYAGRKGRYADARQMAKAANFGFPGGLGAATFVKFAAGYGVGLSEEHARWVKQVWLRKWPEMNRYFRKISDITGDMGSGEIEQLTSGRVRGGVGFCDGANSPFQGLVADAAKHTLWELFKACYSDTPAVIGKVSSADYLYGCRPVAFIHDEVIIEVPDDEEAPRAADALARLMIDVASVWMPDVKIDAEPVLMRRWNKKADTVRDAQGRLQVWEPKS